MHAPLNKEGFRLGGVKPSEISISTVYHCKSVAGSIGPAVLDLKLKDFPRLRMKMTD